MKIAHITALACAAFVVPVLAFSSAKITSGVYTIDENHTRIGFEVPHMVISTVEGQFKNFEGEINVKDEFNKSSVTTTIQTSSINTGNDMRDKHLRSEDFFHAEKYPTMTFVTKSISGSPKSFKVKGDLTIKGVTKEVTLDGKYKGTVLNSEGKPTAAFEAKTQISRKVFGLTYNKLIEAGPAIGDSVTIMLKTEAVLKANESKDLKAEK